MAGDLFSSTPHPTPPTTEEDRLSWLRLIRSRRVGVATFFRLMREYGSASAAVDALPEIARAAGVRTYSPCPPEVAHDELASGRLCGARLICFGDAAYPGALAAIPDPPPVLWAVGDIGGLRSPAVAIVGARNVSSLGSRMARRLASDLAEAGFPVVSGLARGIDTAAHVAALERGTVAVMAGGVDRIYPAENSGLAAKIASQGLLLSEQPIGLAPQARHFPLRNRIISGLCRGVVVVEAAAKSGSLITAGTALEQGREVLAVPGHPFDARALGCNNLIRDGATLVRTTQDVIDALPAAPPAIRQQPAPANPAPNSGPAPASAPVPETPDRSRRQTAQLHRAILNRLGPSPIAEDSLIRDLNLPANTLTPELVALELDGRILRSSGGLLSRLD